MLTNLGYSMNVFQMKPINLSLKNCLGESKIRIKSLANAVGDNLPVIVIGKAKRA